MIDRDSRTLIYGLCLVCGLLGLVATVVSIESFLSSGKFEFVWAKYGLAFYGAEAAIMWATIALTCGGFTYFGWRGLRAAA